MQMLVRQPVWQLSRNPSGIAVYFETNSKQLSVKWTTGNSVVFSHVPATLVKGLDLYAWDNGTWYHAGIGNPLQAKKQEWVMCKGLTGEMRQYLLYLPGYELLDSLQIGVEEGAVARVPLINRFSSQKPIVVYGTSIVQGAAASRPGMAYPAQLGRMLQTETINLGFSGNGQMDSVIAYAMAAINASCYIIDCGPNLSPEQAGERTAPFIRIIKKLRPATPVLLVENIVYPTARFNKVIADKIARTNQAFQTAFLQLQNEKIPALYYLPSDGLIGNDGEATVDGVHLTDLGFYRIAQAIAGKLKDIFSIGGK